jgi:hypothetical protein
MKAQRRSSGIALPFFNLGARWGWAINDNLVPNIHKAGWALGPVRTGARIPSPHWELIPGPSNP